MASGSLSLVDLHTHSTASDGTDSPSALVATAAALGVRTLALTDHDTLSGLPEAAAAAREHGVTFIRGCELAVSSGSGDPGGPGDYGEVHILGLWLAEECPRLEAGLADIRRQRAERNQLLLQKLRDNSYDVSYDDLTAFATGESIGRMHIARAMVAKGYAKTTRELFATLLGDGKALHVPRAMLSPAEALRLLQAEGATTVFAHPMLVKAPARWLESFVAQLVELGLDALEVYHSDHSPADVRRALALADRFGLALSGGSDYHGAARVGCRLGRGRGGHRIPEFIVDRLRILRHQQGKAV